MNLSHHPDYKPKRNCSCGAEDAPFDFIPDTIYFLSIKRACCIHDDRYRRGGNFEDKAKADNEFLSNMLTIINGCRKWYYPKFFARRRALKYYEAVVKFGDSSFGWDKKNNNEGDV